MLDRAIRRRLAPAFDAVAAGLGQRGLQAGLLTGLGLLVGVAACVCAALAWWPPALVLWLLNRLLDGLDGPLARRSKPTALGGLLDFSADFVIYSGFVVAIAIARPPAQLACVALLATYLVNNVVLLSFSSIVERLHIHHGDERSLRFTTGLRRGRGDDRRLRALLSVPRLGDGNRLGLRRSCCAHGHPAGCAGRPGLERTLILAFGWTGRRVWPASRLNTCFVDTCVGHSALDGDGNRRRLTLPPVADS